MKGLKHWWHRPAGKGRSTAIEEQERHDRRVFFYRAFKALAFNRIDGDYAEFGSHQGITFTLAWLESRRHGHPAMLWAFDSFEGLPAPAAAADAHPAWRPGKLKTALPEFHAICRRNGIPTSDYRVVPGFYSQSLGALAAGDAPANIALAYIDCDLYSSTRDVLGFLMPRLKHGMILAFDDYFCWSPGRLSGERQAMLDCLGGHARWQLLPYVQFGWHGQSFVVEDRQIAAGGD